MITHKDCQTALERVTLLAGGLISRVSTLNYFKCLVCYNVKLKDRKINEELWSKHGTKNTCLESVLRDPNNDTTGQAPCFGSCFETRSLYIILALLELAKCGQG